MAWLVRRELDEAQTAVCRDYLNALMRGKHFDDHLYDESSLLELEQKLGKH